MFLDVQIYKPEVPSAESIDFKLSENFITSHNPSIEIDRFISIEKNPQKNYEPQSLTYTASYEEINSREKIPENEPQISLKQSQPSESRPQLPVYQELFKQMQNQNLFPTAAKMMKKKKSILVVQNLELMARGQNGKQNASSVHENHQHPLKSRSRSRIHSQMSNSRRKSHTDRNNHCQNIPSKSHNTKACLSNSKTDRPTVCSTGGFQGRKKSVSSYISTQDKISIYSDLQSLSKRQLIRSASEKPAQMPEPPLMKRKVFSSASNLYNQDILIDNGLLFRKREPPIGMKKNQFLEDQAPLEAVIKTKSIKIQENEPKAKMYLRKIIQNRTSVKHYNDLQNQRLFRS